MPWQFVRYVYDWDYSAGVSSAAAGAAVSSAGAAASASVAGAATGAGVLYSVPVTVWISFTGLTREPLCTRLRGAED